MIEIGPPRDERDWAGYAAVAGQAFRGGREESARWIALAKATAVVRVARDGGRVIAGAAAYRVGQMFGGREVPAGAVADVCVAPERRGSGVARALLAEMVAAMRSRGCAISPLWPSSVRVYRGSGWEVSGGEWEFRVPSHELAGLRGQGEPVPEPGLSVRALQRRRAAAFDGPLARPDWWWRWKHPTPPTEHTFRYAWVESGAVTGFLAFRQTEAGHPSEGHGLDVLELWTDTPDATRGLLGFLGSHASMVREIRFLHAALPSSPPIVHAAELDHLDGSVYGPWMLRLVDPGPALEARGWPDDGRARIHLQIADPLRDAAERLVLEIEGGSATATPGGNGAVRIGVGALSAWYAGHLRASDAARLGLATGPGRDLAALDRLTGGRPVWLPDHF